MRTKSLDIQTRWWRVFGDGSGDGQNTTTAYNTTKSPILAVPGVPGRLYKVRANFEISWYYPSGGGSVNTAILVNGSNVIARRTDVWAQTVYEGLMMEAVYAATGPFLVAIGYSVGVAGQTAYLINSGGVVPFIVAEEMPPSSG